MANIVDLLTLGELSVYSVDSDPSTLSGLSAAIGSIALINDGVNGKMFVKTAAGNTAWDRISTTALAGTVNSGTINRLAVYAATGNNLSDSLSFSSFPLTVSVASHTLSGARAYTVLDVGASANFVMDQGTQTINGSKTFSSAINMSSQKIVSMADPTASQDAATKSYVDSVAQGLTWKAAVRVATTANINLSSMPSTVDSITLVSGDRVLSKNQTTQSQNGIYIFNGVASAATRATDMDVPAEFVGAAVFVDEGTINADTAWVQTTQAPITVGTTSIVFTQFAGAGTYTAGNGLTLTGTQFSANLDSAGGLEFNGAAIRVKLNGATLDRSSSGMKVADGGISDLQVNSAAAIARAKLASGSANHVLINDGSGVMSSEARLALSRTADGTLNFVLVAQGTGVNPAYALITDNNIASAAAIGRTKLAALTANKLMVTDGSGFDSVSAGNGFVKVTSGTPAYQSSISLTTDVSGILPIANGGTNSATALNNNRLMISSAGTIIEHSALTTQQILFANASGLPVGSTNFLFDSATSRLSVGGTNTTRTLDVTGSAIVRGNFKLVDAAGTANMELQSATVATTDATVTTLQSITIPTDSIVLIRTSINARRTGGTAGTAGDGATYIRTARYKNVGGTVTALNVQSDYTSEDQSGFNATLDASGTSARVRINGTANNNLSWQCWTEVYIQL